MTDGPPRAPDARTRRSLLAAGATTAAVATAGCLGSLLGTSSSDEIEPEELSDPPAGTPGEFYTVVEERIDGYDVTVERLFENDGDLILEYRSDAKSGVEEVDEENASNGGDANVSTDGENTTDGADANDSEDENASGDGNTSEDLSVEGPFSPAEEYTLEEAGAITQAFNEVLMKHGDGSEYGMLVGDVVNPIEAQPHGWGVKSEWLEEYNAGDRGAMSLSMAISQLFVYEEDFEDD